MITPIVYVVFAKYSNNIFVLKSNYEHILIEYEKRKTENL